MTESETVPPAASTSPSQEAGADGITNEQVFPAAVRIMTEAARLTWTHRHRRNHHGGRVDWAEFVARALAGAAANIGGIEAVLAGRPGSCEADYVRKLLTGTVGPAGEYLLEHRAEPVVVDLYVDDIPSTDGCGPTKTPRVRSSPAATTRSPSPAPRRPRPRPSSYCCWSGRLRIARAAALSSGAAAGQRDDRHAGKLVQTTDNSRRRPVRARG